MKQQQTCCTCSLFGLKGSFKYKTPRQYFQSLIVASFQCIIIILHHRIFQKFAFLLLSYIHQAKTFHYQIELQVYITILSHLNSFLEQLYALFLRLYEQRVVNQPHVHLLASRLNTPTNLLVNMMSIYENLEQKENDPTNNFLLELWMSIQLFGLIRKKLALARFTTRTEPYLEGSARVRADEQHGPFSACKQIFIYKKNYIFGNYVQLHWYHVQPCCCHLKK